MENDSTSRIKYETKINSPMDQETNTTEEIAPFDPYVEGCVTNNDIPSEPEKETDIKKEKINNMGF